MKSKRNQKKLQKKSPNHHKTIRAHSKLKIKLDYFMLNFRAIKAKIVNPTPKNNIEDGSGTGVGLG